MSESWRSQKERLYQYCLSELNAKIAMAQAAMEHAQQEANLETKSSAGDKYETTRTMMQLEKERYARHQQEALRNREILQHLKPIRQCSDVSLGALIQTDSGWVYFAIGMGNVVLDGISYQIVSIHSPIGQALENAEEGDIIEFRNREIEILELY